MTGVGVAGGCVSGGDRRVVTAAGTGVMDVFSALLDGRCELLWVDRPSTRTAVLETEM